jgi:hypothetical protein
MSTTLGNAYLESMINRIYGYKILADKTFSQLEEKDFHYAPNEESNSIAVIIQHMSGNMLSRWSNFLTEDGEKEWRNRDAEFDTSSLSKAQLLEHWEQGWDCMINTFRSLKEEDLLKTIYIRHEPHIVIDAINRQLAHYPSHVGQIMYIGKMILNTKWQSLSIPRGRSADFNKMMQEGGKK